MLTSGQNSTETAVPGARRGSGRRAVARCDALGLPPFTDTPPQLFRPYLGPAHRAATRQLSDWMVAAGMTVRLDGAANLIGRYEASQDQAPSLLIGSHIDSVKDAGRYDGPLGVMLGIELVDGLRASARRLPFAVEVIAFGDEEGSRFSAAMLGSRAAAGLLTPEQLPDGAEFDQALADWSMSRGGFATARRDPLTLIGYVEAHIEQGPRLEAEGLALGIVTAIAAQRRFELVLQGRAGHAGTNSMRLRRDALTAAAEAVLAVESVASAGPADLVATVGQLFVEPGAANVVPGRVRFTIDVRAGDDFRRDQAAAEIEALIIAIAARRDVGLTWRLVHDVPATPCDPDLTALLEAAVGAIGQPTCRLVSGAGHDAMLMGKVTPMAMLFLRCQGGISHNPAESVDANDADLALSALQQFVETLAQRATKPQSRHGTKPQSRHGTKPQSRHGTGPQHG